MARMWLIIACKAAPEGADTSVQAPTAQAGSRIAWSADLTGDGLGDWLVAAPGVDGVVYAISGATLTAAATLSGPPGEVGIGISGCPDLDGDGQMEAIVGLPDGNGDQGGFRVFDAPLSGEIDVSAGSLVGGTLHGVRTGWSTACNDIDGNGYADLAVSAPDADGFGLGERSGQIFFYEGAVDGDPTVVGSYTTTFSDAALGTEHTLTIDHDLDGDGVADLVVGAPGIDQIFAAPGPFGGSVDNNTTGWTWDTEVGSGFGTSVALADWSGDGTLDLLGGAPEWRNGTGAVWYVLGPLNAGSAGHLDAPTMAGNAPGDESGFALAAPGDLTGDGAVDALVGAPGANDGMGQVYLLDAIEDRPMALAPVTVRGDVGRFGTELATDGAGTFAVGAPFDGEGVVWWFGPGLNGSGGTSQALASFSPTL